jgi:hypothetical protein
LSSSFASPSSGISLEIRNVNEISSLLSYDRTNSLYKLIIDGSNITLNTMVWCFNYSNTGDNIPSNVISLGNISSTKVKSVLEAISNGDLPIELD